MKLLLDIGNTRIKWTTLDGQGLGAQHAAPHAHWLAADIREQVLIPLGRVNEVWVANVGGEAIAQRLREATQQAWGLAPVFLRSSAQQGEVRNAYTDPEKLGVDRWLALIAAHALTPRAACIASVGTAMTVDGIDATGRHLGGVIVPGPDLMMSSLMQNTSDIAARAGVGSRGEGLFADNTLGGVHQGAVHALASLIERAMASLQAQLGETPVLFLTGGASDRVASLLTTPAQSLPDLVLQGLAVVANSADAAARVSSAAVSKE